MPPIQHWNRQQIQYTQTDTQQRYEADEERKMERGNVISFMAKRFLSSSDFYIQLDPFASQLTK